MQAAMVVSWSEPIPGRELKAIEYAKVVALFWNKQAETGKCSAPETFFSERGVGLWMVKGDREALMELHDSNEAQSLMTRGQLLLSDFSVDFYTAGKASEDFMARYAEEAGGIAA